MEDTTDGAMGLVSVESGNINKLLNPNRPEYRELSNTEISNQIARILKQKGWANRVAEIQNCFTKDSSELDSILTYHKEKARWVDKNGKDVEISEDEHQQLVQKISALSKTTPELIEKASSKIISRYLKIRYALTGNNTSLTPSFNAYLPYMIEAAVLRETHEPANLYHMVYTETEWEYSTERPEAIDMGLRLALDFAHQIPPLNATSEGDNIIVGLQ